MILFVQAYILEIGDLSKSIIRILSANYGNQHNECTLKHKMKKKNQVNRFFSLILIFQTEEQRWKWSHFYTKYGIIPKWNLAFYKLLHQEIHTHHLNPHFIAIKSLTNVNILNVFSFV